MLSVLVWLFILAVWFDSDIVSVIGIVFVIVAIVIVIVIVIVIASGVHCIVIE